MADLADAFEQHLKSLSDDEWSELVARVRPTKDGPDGEPPRLATGAGGRAEAQRRRQRNEAGRR